MIKIKFEIVDEFIYLGAHGKDGRSKNTKGSSLNNIEREKRYRESYDERQ